MWFIGGAPSRLLFFIGQLTSLLIVIYDYPAAHEPEVTQKKTSSRIALLPESALLLIGGRFYRPCK